MPIFRLYSIAVLLASVFVLGLGPAPAQGAEPSAWRLDPGLAGVLAPLARARGDEPAGPTYSPRETLTSLAHRLLDTRYRRGGREPSTGFDCSGFVRYVFRHGLDAELPASSAAQFLDGRAIARADLREGDLVFFRTAGKHISHVGIYLGDGSFIHAPSSGKRVSLSRLDEAYWAKRFAGAKRPSVLARVDDEGGNGRG